MAVPKIFVSSTCYDLKEIRDNLYEFIQSLGYTPVFSDKNDVFYHPDLHTHEACLKEIETCQLFVLIIGGRFGGEYKYDTAKSIVNAEYFAAKELDIPITTFVARDVYSNHFMYEKNKGNEIEYTAISNQKYASNIFEFINEVRKSDVNNAIFEFEYARDIRNILKTQYAGMFYDFLWERKNKKETDKTKSLLQNLTTISSKTEEIIENIYRKIEPDKSEAVILDLDNKIKARGFWIALSQKLGFSIRKRNEDELKDFVQIDKKDDWQSYFIRKIANTEITTIEHEGENLKVLLDRDNNSMIALAWEKNNEIPEENERLINNIEIGFEAFKSLEEKARIEIIREITFD